MEKQLGWHRVPGGLQGESHNVSQVDGVSDMAPSYWLCKGRVQQRDNGLSLSWCQTLQSLPIYHWCPSSSHPSAGAQREQIWVGESVCGSPKRNCLGLQQPPPLTQFPLIFAARSCGDLSFWHRSPGLEGLLWVWDSSPPIYPSQIFIYLDVGPACSASAPLLPVWMDSVSSIL